MMISSSPILILMETARWVGAASDHPFGCTTNAVSDSKKSDFNRFAGVDSPSLSPESVAMRAGVSVLSVASLDPPGVPSECRQPKKTPQTRKKEQKLEFGILCRYLHDRFE